MLTGSVSLTMLVWIQQFSDQHWFLLRMRCQNLIEMLTVQQDTQVYQFTILPFLIVNNITHGGVILILQEQY